MQDSTEQDPLAMPASELKEPTFPLLKPDKTYDMAIRSTEVVDGESDKGEKTQQWVIRLATTRNEISVDDQTMYEGAAVFARFFLTPNEQNTRQQIAERVGMVVKAALGKDTKTSPRECMDNPTLLAGKLVKVKIGIKSDKKGNYPDQNTVKAWVVL